jgi:hypothetical protein
VQDALLKDPALADRGRPGAGRNSSAICDSSFLCVDIRLSIGAENLIPKEMNYTKITIRVTVMNKVKFLAASEPRKPLKPRSLQVIFLVEKDVRVKRCRAYDYHHHKII